MIPLRDTVPSRCVPVATIALIAVNTLVFLHQRALSPELQERFVFLFGLVPARDTQRAWSGPWGFSVAEVWPFLTHLFVHANGPHLIGNLWTLWIFGDNVEDRMGSARFIVFYLLGGLAAAAAQCYAMPGARVPMVGASGAVAAVLGAYFVLFPAARIITLVPILFYPLFFALPAATYLMIWFLTQWWAGWLSSLAPTRSGGIAWWAHIGGFVFGLATHRLFVLRRRYCRRRSRDERTWEEFWQRW